ncbi:MAG: serine hydrolase [Pseudomonadota bacterium]
MMDARNWGYPPHNREGVRKVQELFPTARLARDPDRPPAPLGDGAQLDLEAIRFTAFGGETKSAAAALAESYTDAFLVLQGDAIRHESYGPEMSAESPHLVNSVTKTVTGLLAGVAVDEGALSPQDLVADIVPELAASLAWAGVTVRHVLDMTAGVVYGEDYNDRGADFWREAALVGWRPALRGSMAERTLIEYAAARSAKDAEDGARFAYKTLCTNVLGMALERALKEPLQDALTSRIWARLPMRHDGAIVVDAARFPYVGAGLNACARDLAQIGRLMAGLGAVDGAQVVPRAWMEDTLAGGETSKADFAAGEYGPALPNWHYRNQIWVSGGIAGGAPGAEAVAPAFHAIGIHGQLIYAEPRSQVVIVKLSGQPFPVDYAMVFDTDRACAAIQEAIASGA